MSANFKLLDSFKLVGHLPTNFACGLSQDDRIFIISDLGLYIIAQKPNLSCAFPEYMCQKYFLKPSSYALCENVGIDINSFLFDLPKDVIYEAIASVGLTQNLKGNPPAPPSVLQAQWSEANMVDNAWSMLAVLTNIHSLEIYIKSVNESNCTEYKSVLNVTEEMVKKQTEDFVYSVKMPPTQKVKELKKRVEFIAPLTLEWSHTFTWEGQNCAVMFIGHYCGDISIWRIHSVESSDENSQCEFVCRYKSKLSDISALCWHRTSEHDGVLCAGDSNGRLLIFRVINLDKETCCVSSEVQFFTEKDRQIDKITVITFGDYVFVIAVKQCYLLIYGLDSSGKVFDFLVHCVENFYITGITHHNNTIRVLTITGSFKELQLSVHFNKIAINETNIPLKFDLSAYRTHGFVQSSNKLLVAVILAPCRLGNSIRGKKFINFNLFTDISLDPLEILFENQTGSLRTFWDCFETLRISCLKEQKFPWSGSKLELDSLSLVKLKTVRLLAKLSETVFTVIKRVVSYEIQPYILLHYLVDIKLIVQRLAQLFEDKSKGRELSLFELRSVDLQVFFLKELVISGIIPKAQVGQSFINEISHILGMANEIKFPDMMQCNFCGEKLIGSMCLPPHADSRCALTMMPILLAPAYKCALCNSLCHKETAKTLKYVLCSYCDYPMERVCLSEKIKEKIEKLKTTSDSEYVFSECASDCIGDSSEVVEELVLNLPDCDVTVAHVSDDDEEVQENRLAKLYFSMANLKVEDLEKTAQNVIEIERDVI